MQYLAIHNCQTVSLSTIPILGYDDFFALNTGFIANSTHCHCVSYFGYAVHEGIRLMCCIANDETHLVNVSSCVVHKMAHLNSMSSQLPCFEKFEREIHENFGIFFTGHPWLKPVRYAQNRYNPSQLMQDYPFYGIDSEELHEVGVGPIHAGVIEPGHFRFICNGEQILHLEIQLGYQHRGVEPLFVEDLTLLQRTVLAESIAGDTVVGHTWTFAALWESLCGFSASPHLLLARTVALEIERMAIHTGDLSALCGDVAYQLGNSVFGRLRTPLVNFMQEWGGNRLGKGFIRPGENPYPLTKKLASRLLDILHIYERDFNEMADKLFSLPSALSRFERTGTILKEELLSIGAVGMAARAGGLVRDVRFTHPFGVYHSDEHMPVVLSQGDVYARAEFRRREIAQSMAFIRHLLSQIPEIQMEVVMQPPASNAFVLSMTEGWRGEICHCAITGGRGELVHYKVKDPSFHNWMALALAVRNNEISDFPVCNKSFNLSYAGHDL